MGVFRFHPQYGVRDFSALFHRRSFLSSAICGSHGDLAQSGGPHLLGQRIVFKAGSHPLDVFGQSGLQFGRNSSEFVAILVGLDQSLTKGSDEVFHANGWVADQIVRRVTLTLYQ